MNLAYKSWMITKCMKWYLGGFYVIYTVILLATNLVINVVLVKFTNPRLGEGTLVSTLATMYDFSVLV